MLLYKKQNSKTKVIIIVIIALFVIAATYLALAFYNHYPPFASVNKDDNSGQKIDLERSDAEKQKTQELLDNPESKTENNQTDTPNVPTETTPSGKQSVNVLLTNAGITNGTVRASGFVTDLAQEGGECTYLFTSGNATLTKKSATLINPTSTTCEAVSFSANELPVDGAWKVVLSYDSANAAGTSNAKEFTK